MKTSYLLNSIFLFGLLINANAQSDNSVLIENFEDGNNQNSLGGYWYTFNDNNDGGKSHLIQKDWQKEGLVNTGGHESKGMLKVDVVLEKASYQWSPYFAFGTNVAKTTTLTPASFAGISYWHKGVGHKMRIETPEVTDYDFYQIPVPASEEWTLVTIDFSQLNQSGWGKKAPLNLNNSIKLVWNLDEASGNFQLDEIRFVKEVAYTPQKNMEILPPQIPAPLALKGNISSPLNDLSKKHLTKGMNLASWAEANKIKSANPNDWKYNEATIKLQAKQGIQGIRFP
ncbi:MAG: endoglucanase, partial [Cytophagales bacterium]|nr:endoglucanase [Cytophagales bacterium]